MKRIIYSTKQKAVKINIEDSVFGTLAEIGGGQEVARAFFQAGGASGTVAKSISAYDKTFSDYYYNNNKPGRYVSSDRLEKMLNKEYLDLQNVITNKVNNETFFFSFADTVETLNYHKTNSSHGWMGMRFQISDREEPNEVKIHFNLKENDATLQQYTLGTLGINLIYACFHLYKSPNSFLQSLMDNLDFFRIEIDTVSMSGPDLDYVDNRLLGVQLVKNGMAHAVIFNKEGKISRIGDMVYKKNVIAIRGSFRPITYVGFDMIKSSIHMLKREEKEYDKTKTVVLCEITMRNLMATLQQYTLGTLGINLIYACFHLYKSPNSFLQSLMDNLDFFRIEIDTVSMSGPDLDYVDNRLLGVQLVKNGMAHAVIFNKEGKISRIGDMVYKKNVIAIRGSFRPITYVGFDMIKSSIHMLKREEKEYDKTKTVVLCEITMRNLMANGELDERDFLARVDILNGMNQNVLISNYTYFYRLTEFFNKYTINKLRVVVGVPTLKNLVQAKYYKDLKGGLMEAFGKLFAKNVKLYVYPLIENKRLQTGRLLNVDENIFYLYQHLLNNDKIVDLENINRSWQGIFARDALRMIQNGEKGWEKMMPVFISKQIKREHLFGYKAETKETNK